MESHSARLAWVGCGARLSTGDSGVWPRHPGHRSTHGTRESPSGCGIAAPGTALVPVLSLCPTRILAIPSPVPVGSLSLAQTSGQKGCQGTQCHIPMVTAGTALMVPGEPRRGHGAALGPWSPLPLSSSATPPWRGPGGGDSLGSRMWLQSPWPWPALTGLYSGSHSGMLRLLISEAIFFLCPGLVTPMAVRSWGREGGSVPPCPGRATLPPPPAPPPASSG